MAGYVGGGILIKRQLATLCIKVKPAADYRVYSQHERVWRRGKLPAIYFDFGSAITALHFYRLLEKAATEHGAKLPPNNLLTFDSRRKDSDREHLGQLRRK